MSTSLSISTFPSDAEHLIRWMLSFNPEDRPTIEQVLNHPWLQAPSSSSSSSPSSTSPTPTMSSSSMSASSSNSESPSSSHSDSGFSSHSGSSHFSHQSNYPAPSPNLRYNFRSSTLAAGSGHKPKATSNRSQTPYFTNSISHHSSMPQSSSMSLSSTTRPGHQHLLRSETRLKSHSPYQNGSLTTPTGSPRKPPHSPLNLWKISSTKEHENDWVACRSPTVPRK